ncbi:MAG: 16S rRNA (guanine(966)-N(2))-methyltransferase RsmD [Actinomycetota bacterium]|nr:16S rRNA (guanine(966)-N(2))-methyltransferase RsmD [Actinomycetota bacterium]
MRAQTAKSIRLKKGDFSVRPTLSKVRQALFNIVAPRIEGAVFFDLYAGTGAIGMEAMSRGASTVYFVESERKLANGLNALLDGCGCRAKAVIFNAKAADFLEKSARRGIKADIIFMDPPYASGELEAAINLLAGKSSGVLADGAVVITEHPTRNAAPEAPGVLEKKRDYKYGDTTLTLYEVVLRGGK